MRHKFLTVLASSLRLSALDAEILHLAIVLSQGDRPFPVSCVGASLVLPEVGAVAGQLAGPQAEDLLLVFYKTTQESYQ